MNRRLFLIIGGALVLIGLIVSAIIFVPKYLDSRNKNLYSVGLVFVDENGNRVTDVKIYIGKKEISYILSGTTIQLYDIPEDSKLTFEVEGYSFKDSDTYVVKRNVSSYRVELIDMSIATFILTVTDTNLTPITNASVFYDEKNIGKTDSNGQIKYQAKDITKSIRVEHNYFDFLSIDLNLEFGKIKQVSVVGDFNKDKFQSLMTGEDYNFTYSVNNEESKKLNGVYFSYRLLDDNRFLKSFSFENKHTFENELFDFLFAYGYSEIDKKWYTSEIYYTSPLSTSLSMTAAKAAYIDTKTPYQSIYTSDGRCFAAGVDGKVTIVLPTFDGIKFYKNYNFETKEYSNEVLIVDKDGSEFTNYSDLNYNLYLVNK